MEMELRSSDDDIPIYREGKVSKAETISWSL